MILRKFISLINVHCINKTKGVNPLIKTLKPNYLNNLICGKVIIITSFLICITISAQKVKKDKYLDSLAKKIQFKYKEPIFIEGSLNAIKEIAEYVKKNENYYSVESHTCMKGKKRDNQILTDKRAVMIEKLLIKFGLQSDRLIFIGLGQDSPCCLIGKTGRSRYLNRN